MRWVDISVGKKLYATFCAFILFFLITMGAMLFYLDIVNKDAEILSQPSKDGALLAAEVAHLQWAMNVQNFVLQQGKTPLSVPTDGRQCDFGKWFYGPQRQELEQEVPGMRAIFAKVEDVHTKLHATAHTIKEHMDAGRHDEARAFLQSNTLPLLADVQKLLSQSRNLLTDSKDGLLQHLAASVSNALSLAFIAAVIYIIFAITISVLLVRNICKPLTRITTVADKAARGIFEPSAIDRGDEIGRLAKAFDLAGILYNRRPDAPNKPIKGYLQLGKLVIFCVAAILIIATLINRNPLILLSGLGAMAAVLMLIFQDTILSLVASLQIGSNDMVRIGDWIEMPSQNADGDVIEIALHTVKVRNWDKTITTLPVRKLITDSFKNWRGMQEAGGRRIKRSLFIDQRSVRFLEDAEVVRLEEFVVLNRYLEHKRKELAEWNRKLEEMGARPVNERRVTNLGTFRAYAEEYLRHNPHIRQDMTLLVRQLQPGATGIPLEIYCFTNDTRWAVYEGIQSDIFDHLLAILPVFGLRVYQQCSDLSGMVPPANGFPG